MEGCKQAELQAVANEISEEVEIRLEYEAAYDWIAFCPRRNDDAGALTRYFGKRAGEPAGDAGSYKRRGIECRQRSTPSFLVDVQLQLMQEFGRTRSPEAVCERLRESIEMLRDGEIAPEELAITNRVSKRVEEYTQTTKNVAALERAADLGLEKHPGQDVEYVVVDDEKSGRARVALLHEEPERYDAEFYRNELLRVAESVLAPAGYRREDIEQHLAERTDAVLPGFS